MTKKIFKSIFAAALLVLVTSLVVFTACIYNFFLKAQESMLTSEMALARQGVESSGEDYFDGLRDSKCRLTWIAKDGTVIADTVADPKTMENHKDRSEVAKAFETGSGRSSRYSTTLMEKTTFLAEKLSDGTVLRASVTRSSIVTMMIELVYLLVMITILAVILAAVFASGMSRSIIKPLNDLDLDNPLENDVYDELSPFLTHMEQQNRRIKSQFEEIDKSRREFDAVTENMSEGLVVLNSTGRILSLNNAAKKFFGADDCEGRDFLTVERNSEIIAAIEKSRREDKSEIQFSRDGREYQINVTTIGEEPMGTVILIFDVTEKVFAERNRREFTANVSHELKTPLQSIMGSAELIETGLVKDEDLPRFVENIHREASRLMVLIEDIIRLSQLDEKSEIPSEKVDVAEVAGEVVKDLQTTAEGKDVTLALHAEKAVITAARRLVYEIIYNLSENAVKYNKPKGRVDVSVSKSKDGVKLEVKDTGIGIPPEHQSRVFERFYRVDKSRSKDTGGTGLGLSIVKHAAEDLGAAVELKSEEGVGTDITVVFGN